LAKSGAKSIYKIFRAMAVMVSEILDVRRASKEWMKRPSYIWYLRGVGIFSFAVGSFLLFLAAFR
jgi:hypothetical protein